MFRLFVDSDRYLEVGTTAAPFPYPATITLYGNASSPALVLDNSYFLGNKVMAVFGNVSVVGPVPTVTWSKLSAPASAGDTSITIADTVTWPVGATIVITPTEYDNRQRDEVVISAVTPVAGGGTTLSFTPALSYRHAAASVGGRMLSAAVGLVSRSITFAGDSATGGYGAHVVVGQVTVNQDYFLGNVVFRGVQFTGVGQMSSEYPAVLFNLPSPGPKQLRGLTSTVDSCSFESFNYAIVAQNFQRLVATNNVVALSYRTAFDVDAMCGGISLVNNLVAGVYRPPDAPTDWVRPMAGFYLDTVATQLSGNVAAGSDDSGFVIRPPACGSPAAANGAFAGNEAHGVMVGLFLLPVTGCTALSHWTVWKASHLAVVAVDMIADVYLDSMFIADSHIGTKAAGGEAEW